MKPELQRMFELVEKTRTAILVTHREDGHLVARPMALQAEDPGADLWFVTSEGTGKLEEIDRDPHVNVTFFRKKSEWVSIAGLAQVSRDRDRIRRLYRKDWRIFFSKEGDPRHGTPDDPRMVLLGVDVVSAVYAEQEHSTPVVLYEMAKGYLTGERPDIGEPHHVSGEKDETRAARPGM